MVAARDSYLLVHADLLGADSFRTQPYGRPTLIQLTYVLLVVTTLAAFV
jgi:hypothetical protein